MGKTSARTHEQENVKVIAERPSATPGSKRVARLVKVDGKLMCECPYACLATTEKCAFDDEFNWENESNPIKRYFKKFRLQHLT